MQRIARKILAILLCTLLFSAFFDGSEDSLQSVMEGYINPQELFSNVDTNSNKKDIAIQKNLQNLNAEQNPQNLQTKADSKPKIKPQDMKEQQLPDWIYSTGIIESTFSNGLFKKGFGVLLENGLFLTSSEILYSRDSVPKEIFIKMQDDKTKNIICVAKLQLKALDLDAGLALLKISQSVDEYCHARTQSYYQDRIYKKYSINAFKSNKKMPEQTNAFYPYLHKSYTFVPYSVVLDKLAFYRDYDLKEDTIYGYEIQQESYEEYTYGRAFFDENGDFMGILSKIGYGFTPVFVNRAVVQDFLCDIVEKNVIIDSKITNACNALGDRKRYFNEYANSFGF